MATHDYVIANQGFPAFRSDLNNALAAIVSNNSSATEPTTMFAHMIWVDTAADPSILKIRNADNDAWITIGSIDQTGDTFTMVNLKTSGPVVFNDAGADVDFRVEGDTDANLLFVDASAEGVGIGLSSPNGKLSVAGNITLEPGGSGPVASSRPQLWRGADGFLGIQSGADTSGIIAFYTSSSGTPSHRMRITSGGTVGVNNTNPSTGFKFVANGATGGTASVLIASGSNTGGAYIINTSGASECLVLNHEAAAGTTKKLISGFHGVFGVSAAESFAVFNNGNVVNTNNSYGPISDLKLKQDIVDAGSQWNDLKAIRIRKFRFKNDPDGVLQIGVIAQELEEVSPGLVSEHPDYEMVDVPVLDDDGNPVLDDEGNPKTRQEQQATGETTKSVKATVLYMKAVKALQEAMERIETLEAKVAALETGV